MCVCAADLIKLPRPFALIDVIKQARELEPAREGEGGGEETAMRCGHLPRGTPPAYLHA